MVQSRIRDCPLWLALLTLSNACVPSSQLRHPLFGSGITTVAMQNREVKFVCQQQLLDAALKQIPVTAIPAPFEMPFVDIAPVQFIAVQFQLVPLDAGMQNVQNVAEDLVSRQFWLWPARTAR